MIKTAHHLKVVVVCPTMIRKVVAIVATESFIINSLLFAAVVTLAMVIGMQAMVVMMIAISSSLSNNGINND